MQVRYERIVTTMNYTLYKYIIHTQHTHFIYCGYTPFFFGVYVLRPCPIIQASCTRGIGLLDVPDGDGPHVHLLCRCYDSNIIVLSPRIFKKRKKKNQEQ